MSLAESAALRVDEAEGEVRGEEEPHAEREILTEPEDVDDTDDVKHREEEGLAL